MTNYEVVNSFKELFSFANASESADSISLKFLWKLKKQMLSEDKECICKAARVVLPPTRLELT